MKPVSALPFVAFAALCLGACGDPEPLEPARRTFCFDCHSESTPLGVKIESAQAGYDKSGHKQGQVGRLYVQLAATGGCPSFVAATASDCTGVGGTFTTIGAGPTGVCSVPRSTGQAACDAAGGKYESPVQDPRSKNACPPFSQPASSGLCATVFGAGAFDGTTCTPEVPPGADAISQNACQSAGGTWVGPSYVLGGTEFEGTNAFYANAGGCQICHTQEGFRKRISGAYDDDGTAADRYASIRFAWDPKAQVGSPTSSTATPPVKPTPLTRDVIRYPSPIGCFGCHTPHGAGSPDGETLTQTIPPGTPITTQTGAVWGNATVGQNKARGHLCAACHQIRLASNPTVIAAVLAPLTGTGKASLSGSYGPHHGPQTDLVLGRGGAQYSGTAQNGAAPFAFVGTYGNSAHSTNINADCISCHMQSDLSDIDATGNFGASAAVGGHSFANKGIVHGEEKALAIGCGSSTGGVGCHSVAGVATSTGTRVVATTVTRPQGFLQEGDALFRKLWGPAPTDADSEYHLRMNELLTKLANPSASCTGLLSEAAASAGGRISWLFMNDRVTVDPRCLDDGAAGLDKAAAPLDDNTNASVRFAKGLWNFKLLLREDKSFGVHNTTYALQLLYDSCVDLALLTGKACGSQPRRCTYCEGRYVTVRP